MINDMFLQDPKGGGAMKNYNYQQYFAAKMSAGGSGLNGNFMA